MFSKKIKKIILMLLIGTFILSLPFASFANVAQESLVKDHEIVVLREKYPNENAWRYTKVLAVDQVSAMNGIILKAVLDEESQLYKVVTEHNLYLTPVSADSFQSMEKNTINDSADLSRISDQYQLTQTQSDDINSIMSANPHVQIAVYAPHINEATGNYNGKKCRLVQVTATDNLSQYYLGFNTISSTLNTIGLKVNIGSMLTNAFLNLFGINLEPHSDVSSIAQKNETAHFQYLDFLELGSLYVTRGTSSFGTITMTIATTCWVKDSNGDFTNQPTVKSLSGQFGISYFLSNLAEKCEGYFENYSDTRQASYNNYTTSFKIDRLTSIPAIFPKR